MKPNLKANYGPQQYLCSAQGSSPVKTQHTSITRALRVSLRAARFLTIAAMATMAAATLAQQPQTIDQIRVIGNRRIRVTLANDGRTIVTLTEEIL